MKNLESRLLEITTNNIVKKSTKVSINDLIVKVLTKGTKMTRPQLVSAIAKVRYEAEYGVITDKDLDDKEVIEKFLAIVRTVKNGVDTSISRSNNNSSFHFNPDFKKYVLECSEGKYYISNI
jgi:hypothetical protein